MKLGSVPYIDNIDIIAAISDVALITTNKSGEIAEWFNGAELLHGYKKDEVAGKSLGCLYCDEDIKSDLLRRELESAALSGSYEADGQRLHKNGQNLSLRIKIKSIEDGDGVLQGFVICEHLLSEGVPIAGGGVDKPQDFAEIMAQQQASQYARSLIEASLDPLVTISPDGKITDVNDASVNATGVPREQLIGTDFSDYFTESGEARAGYQKAFDEGSVSDYPLTIRHRDGSLLDVLYNASVYRDTAGKVLGVFAAARDVTKQNQASQYARSLIEASLDPLVTISPDGKITDVNDASVQATGVAQEQLIGTDFSDYFTEPDQARAGYQTVFEKGSVSDYPLTIRHRDGGLVDVLYNASVYRDTAGKVLGVFAAARDVTEQKQVSQYARSLIEASLDPLVTISPGGKITDVNEASVQATGVDREQLIGTDFSDYFTEPSQARAGYQTVFENGSVSDYPLTIRHRDGSLIDVLYNASVYRDTAGNVLGVFAAARDVTEQKQASQYARSLIEASLDPLVTISPDGKITDVNDASVQATGVAREHLIGTDFSDYFTEPDQARAGYQTVFEKGSVSDYPLTIRHRDGRLIDVLYNASVYRDTAGKVLGVFAAARDVTAQKRAEFELAERRNRELERLAELENFQKLTVGRELKMIELKKEIVRLKSLLPDDGSV